MPEDYQPDVLSKFSLFRNKLEELSNFCNEEYGSSAKVTFEIDLLWARLTDICDDVENLVCGSYD